jgi:hypothetical protein
MGGGTTCIQTPHGIAPQHTHSTTQCHLKHPNASPHTAHSSRERRRRGVQGHTPRHPPRSEGRQGLPRAARLPSRWCRGRGSHRGGGHNGAGSPCQGHRQGGQTAGGAAATPYARISARDSGTGGGGRAARGSSAKGGTRSQIWWLYAYAHCGPVSKEQSTDHARQQETPHAARTVPSPTPTPHTCRHATHPSPPNVHTNTLHRDLPRPILTHVDPL